MPTSRPAHPSRPPGAELRAAFLAWRRATFVQLVVKPLRGRSSLRHFRCNASASRLLLRLGCKGIARLRFRGQYISALPEDARADEVLHVVLAARLRGCGCGASKPTGKDTALGRPPTAQMQVEASSVGQPALADEQCPSTAAPAAAPAATLTATQVHAACLLCLAPVPSHVPLHPRLPALHESAIGST